MATDSPRPQLRHRSRGPGHGRPGPVGDQGDPAARGRTHQRRELVARGLSNPDIATELYVSRRTVQTHVSNILIKLDLRSRVEVAREYASRTGTMSR